ncbi:HEAT repeat domain-containing protein [Daejeonella sp.]|uniref:HEAT repeat domain-containing protein n=1 Tax=Daejeonella sp. TaxID=2805397 RepID=UPI0030C42506
MEVFDITNLIGPGLSFFGYLIITFWLVTTTLCTFILNYLYIVNKRETRYERWKFIADTFIRKAIFFEEVEPQEKDGSPEIIKNDLPPTPKRLQKLLPNPYFRKLITIELLSAMDSMSGTAAANLKRAFYQVKLNTRVSKMLDSPHWHIKAAGIQQAGIMGMDEFKDKISRFINHERRLIRVEAQNTILKLSGFDGLRFLDDVTYPISEWQRLRILEELSRLPPENFTGIDKWLKSKNDTVVIFALKLAKVYFRFELYEEVRACLSHQNSEVRRQAILACTELQTQDTARQLINRFRSEEEKNQLLIIKALSQIGTEEDIPFLSSLLFSENIKVVIASAYSLADLGENGMAALESHTKAAVFPLDRIITEIKSEVK